MFSNISVKFFLFYWWALFVQKAGFTRNQLYESFYTTSSWLLFDDFPACMNLPFLASKLFGCNLGLLSLEMLNTNFVDIHRLSSFRSTMWSSLKNSIFDVSVILKNAVNPVHYWAVYYCSLWRKIPAYNSNFNFLSK